MGLKIMLARTACYRLIQVKPRPLTPNVCHIVLTQNNLLKEEKAILVIIEMFQQLRA